ncbi:MAG: asparaginase [Bacteroidota bacterium]
MKGKKPNVLLIYTGGTIGMINDPKTGSLKAFDFRHLSSQIPELERLNVTLSSISFPEPVDSSEMNPGLWSSIAEIISENYDKHDGFVVLHGSDTMAYTASALSFMLQGLQKPVILTGSQLPIGTIRTDGKENIITAIEIAADTNADGSAKIQEVAIYFEYSLYRGNRTTKISASHFEAFKSPNYPELAIAGVQINYQLRENYPPQRETEFFTAFDNRIALLKIFPGFSPNIYAGIFNPGEVKGIVIESFGSGNVPSDKKFQQLVSDYLAAGGVILNITQCSTGSVDQGKYQTGSFFNAIGVTGGKDLTTEAAITKMMYLFGKYSDRNMIIQKLSESICGEMSL